MLQFLYKRVLTPLQVLNNPILIMFSTLQSLYQLQQTLLILHQLLIIHLKLSQPLVHLIDLPHE